MRNNRLTLLMIIFILVLSCKERHVSNKTVKKIKSTVIPKKVFNNTPNLKEQNELVKKALKDIDRLTDTKSMEDFYGEYKKKDTSCWIEGAEDEKTKKKLIQYSRSYHDKNNERNNNFLSLFLSDKKNISLVTSHIYRRSNRKQVDAIKDTFFFKNNKIYFWKNKQATKEELLKKEKEILAIKKEIDSVMEW